MFKPAINKLTDSILFDKYKIVHIICFKNNRYFKISLIKVTIFFTFLI